MPHYRAPLRDIDFLLHEIFESESHYADLEGCERPRRELLDAIVRGAAEFAEEVVSPLFRVGDEQGCRFESGEVRTQTAFAMPFVSMLKAVGRG